MTPFLTIALPTYNRAKKLMRSLEILRLTCREEINSDLVDFCIINNASPDETEAIIEKMATDLKIRYIRNDRNIGGNNNILKSMTESRGDFTWIIGDDDIVLPGVISSILKMLQTNLNIDFLGLPLGLIHEEDLALVFRRTDYSMKILDYVKNENGGLLDFIQEVGSNEGTLEWEELVDPRFNSVFLGAVMASVFRTQPCMTAARSATISDTRQDFDRLDNTYPHSMIFARCFIGKKALVLPRIALAAIIWEREWMPYQALLVTKRLNDLLDFYESCGVKRERTDKCRRSLFRAYRGIFWKMVFERNHIFRQDFNFFQQVRKYSRFKEFWLGLLPGRRSLISRLARRIRREARRIVHG